MNEKFSLCKEVHRSFVSNPKYLVFRSPVNWKEMNLPDYPVIIKQPMDLGTIDRRLKKEYYKTPAEYVTDMRLIYRNCMTYNAEGSDLYEIGRQFMEEFESKVTDLHLLDFAFRLGSLKTKQRIDQFLREMESAPKEVKDCCFNVLRIVCPECIVYIDETRVNISTDKMTPDALDYILEFLVSMKSEWSCLLKSPHGSDHLPFCLEWEQKNETGNNNVRECSFLFCGSKSNMSILGIDFGSDACVIAQAGGMGAALGRGGIDIVLNDNSKRRTPSIVSFQDRERFIGEHAEPLLRSNAKNTPSLMKSLLGKHFSDPDVQEEKKKLPFKLVPLEDDHIGIEVFYDGAQRTFTPEQITAILLNHCAVLAQKDSKTSGKSDVVISVPPFWNDAQRRAMYHASQIAGVRCLRLINENAAAALDYGIYRNLKGEFSDKPVHVLFVDMGYTATHATVAAFTTGKVQLLSCAYDRKLGSRCCDEAIANYIAKGFIAKYHSDPRSSPRSMAKLMAAAEKVKKTLSPAGVTKTPIYIECLHDDRDYQSELTLKDFQKMCSDQGLPERLQNVALQALKDAGLSTSDAFVCEIIGGGMRVPQMKAALAEALGKKLDEPNNGLSTTLNMDETVARGCAMQCAILSPRIRVKSYEIVDVVPYTIICRSQVNGKTQELELYKKGDTFPSYRRITFHTKEDIQLQLEYSQESLQMMMPGTRPMIAQTTVKALDKMKTAEDPVVYVNFCFDAHGLCYLYNASVKIALPPEPVAPKKEETMEVEGEAAKEEKKEDAPKEEKKEEAPKEEKKPEIKYSTDSLETQSVFNGLTVAQIKEAEETEKKMLEKDAEIRMRNEAKNDLEAYVYMMRDRVNNMYKSFILDNVRTDFMDQLDKAESWLYDDEGYNASRETFMERLSLLKKVGDPVVFRYTESQNRPEAVTQLSQRLESLTRQLDTPNEKYDHITAEERKPVRDLIAESKQWLEKMLNEQAALAMTVDPVLKCSDCFDRIHNVDALFNKVMSKPKPKPKEEKKEEKKDAPKEEKKDAPKDAPKEEKMEEEEKKEEPEQGSKMEEE